MPQKRKNGLPDVSAWQALRLRLTAFPDKPDYRLEDISWWTELVGEPSHRRELLSREGLLREEGPFKGNALGLGVQANRIDWVIVADSEQKTERKGDRGRFDTMGSFPQAVEVFLPLMQRWLKKCPPIKRLAFGGNFVQLMKDTSSANQHISKYLPFVDLEGTSDFLYRINRPRDSVSGIKGLRINRLSTWSSGEHNIIRVVTTLVTTKSLPTEQTQKSFMCYLELDINTIPDFPDKLPHKKLSQILEELIDLGKEVAERGDVR